MKFGSRPLDKSVELKINFLTSLPKHMFWVLQRTVSNPFQKYFMPIASKVSNILFMVSACVLATLTLALSLN